MDPTPANPDPADAKSPLVTVGQASRRRTHSVGRSLPDADAASAR